MDKSLMAELDQVAESVIYALHWECKHFRTECVHTV